MKILTLLFLVAFVVAALAEPLSLRRKRYADRSQGEEKGSRDRGGFGGGSKGKPGEYRLALKIYSYPLFNHSVLDGLSPSR